MKRLIFSTISVIENDDGNSSEVLFNRIVEVEDNKFEVVYPHIKEAAYNGEVTVEEIEDPITEPSQLDRVEAQVTYTALMTDTLLEEV